MLLVLPVPQVLRVTVLQPQVLLELQVQLLALPQALLVLLPMQVPPHRVLLSRQVPPLQQPQALDRLHHLQVLLNRVLRV